MLFQKVNGESVGEGREVSSNEEGKDYSYYIFAGVGVVFIIFVIVMLVFYSGHEGGLERGNGTQEIKNPAASKEGVLKTNELLFKIFKEAEGLNNVGVCYKLPNPFVSSCRFNYYTQYALKVGDVKVCGSLKDKKLSCVISFALANENESSISNKVEYYCEGVISDARDRNLCYLYLSEAFNKSFCSNIWDNNIRNECVQYFNRGEVKEDDVYLIQALNNGDMGKCDLINNESVREACIDLVRG